jgi:putative endonuclease
MPSWHVYLVRCADDSLYCGCTNDLPRRVAAHNAGTGARYTRSRRPVKVVWSVRVKDRSAALSREWKVKQLTRAQKLALTHKKKG